MSSPHRRPTAPLADSADTLPVPGPRLLWSRALRLRCPACGGRPVVLGWLTLASSCPSCGLHLDRDEPGYWVGSYTINLFLTEAVFALAFGLGLLLSWPRVPWTALTVICAALAVLTPALLFPHTKLLYLALDLVFRPLEPADLLTPAERALNRPASPRSP